MTLIEFRRRPTLPGHFQPSTISVLRLNFCVRDGNRWIPQAIVTGNLGLSRCALPFAFPFGPAPLRAPFGRFALLPSQAAWLRSLFLAPSKPHRFAFTSLRLTMAPFRYSLRHSSLPLPLPLRPLPASLSFLIIFSDQALDRLVSPSSIHYCTSTDDLSTLSSSRGLTCF